MLHVSTSRWSLVAFARCRATEIELLIVSGRSEPVSTFVRIVLDGLGNFTEKIVRCFLPQSPC
jgi:hypothetical protein